MNNIERDKFLTEKVLDKCWHTEARKQNKSFCAECGVCWIQLGVDFTFDFSTWELFGKLWEAAKEKDWWDDIKVKYNGENYMEFAEEPDPNDWEEFYIDPDNFANAVYDFLKG